MLPNPIPSTKDTLGFDHYREELTRQGRLPDIGAPKRGANEPVRQPSDRVNIVWFMADQLRADVFGFAGHPFVQTPNLDRLAAKGTAFTRSYCNSPVCGPARASMMTGTYLNDHGVLQNNFRMRPEATVFPKIFEEHGYRTASIGKTHCGRGSQEIWGQSQNPQDAFGATMPASTSFNPDHFPDAVYLHHQVSPNPNRLLYGRYPAPVDVTKSYRIVTEAMKWIYYNQDPRPFFLRLSFDDPHPPVVPPEPFYSMYDPEEVPDALVADVQESLQQKPRVFQEYRERMGSAALTEADHRKHAAVYLGFVSHVDAQIGRFLDYYEQSEFAANTIYVVNSDHGHYIGEHGFAGKGVGLHEGVTRIPTVVAWPGKLPEGRTSAVLTDGTDLMPTLLELAGIEVPAGIRGRSLVPVLRGERDRHKEALFLQWSDFGFSLVRDEWKLIWYIGDNEGELYHLGNDPGEKSNRIDDPALESIRRSMMEELEQLRQSTP